MSKKNSVSNTGKHLTLEDRIEIQAGLDSGLSIRAISIYLNKHSSTILREVKKHTIHYPARQNTCMNRKCTKVHMCNDLQCKKYCRVCARCSAFCEEYIERICADKTSNTLQLCNGCTRFFICNQKKSKYEAKKANEEYINELKSKRSGFDLTEEQIDEINLTVTPLVKQGLSPYAIKQTLGNNLPISESTLRRLVDAQKLDARRIDLRDAVKRKPRKKQRTMKDEIVSVNKEGHLYSDYLEYVSNNEDTFIAQMDCVEGLRTDNKTLLTLHFPSFHFQLAFLMEYHTSKCVVKALDELERQLGSELYRLFFGVILTDNGHEFTDIHNMERSIYGGKRTTIFFCEPNHSEEKAECETNHKFIRYVLPKKSSFENLTQNKVTLMMNHINNYPRKSLMGRTPYQVLKAVFPNSNFFSALGIQSIPSHNVCLTPELLKR